MSQQEDDLRALAKIMDFLRAVSIILVVMNVYWFCYEVIRLWGVNIGVVDRILLNFDRTAGLFHSILYTKLFAVLLLALSCLGTKGVKGEKITWGRIWTALAAGSVLFFLNWWILALPLPIEAVMGLYGHILHYLSNFLLLHHSPHETKMKCLAGMYFHPLSLFSSDSTV